MEGLKSLWKYGSWKTKAMVLGVLMTGTVPTVVGKNKKTAKVVENSREKVSEEVNKQTYHATAKDLALAEPEPEPEPEANPEPQGLNSGDLYYSDKYGNRIELYPELRKKLLTEAEKNEIESKKKILRNLRIEVAKLPPGLERKEAEKQQHGYYNHLEQKFGARLTELKKTRKEGEDERIYWKDFYNTAVPTASGEKKDKNDPKYMMLTRDEKLWNARLDALSYLETKFSLDIMKINNLLNGKRYGITSLAHIFGRISRTEFGQKIIAEIKAHDFSTLENYYSEEMNHAIFKELHPLVQEAIQNMHMRPRFLVAPSGNICINLRKGPEKKEYIEKGINEEVYLFNSESGEHQHIYFKKGENGQIIVGQSVYYPKENMKENARHFREENGHIIETWNANRSYAEETAYEMLVSDWSSDVCSSDLFKKNYF